MKAPCAAVERAVGDAEGVAREDAGVRRVDDRVMMQGVPGGVDQLEGARAQGDTLAVLNLLHACRRQRHDFPVQAREAFLAVDHLGAGDEFLRIDQVRGAARMQQGARVGQRLQQRAGTAGVIQVHVREEEVVDRGALDAECRERGQQVRHGEVGADVDERGPPAVADQVRRRVPGVQVLGIDGGDTVRVPMEARFNGRCWPCQPSWRCGLTGDTS